MKAMHGYLTPLIFWLIQTWLGGVGDWGGWKDWWPLEVLSRVRVQCLPGGHGLAFRTGGFLFPGGRVSLQSHSKALGASGNLNQVQKLEEPGGWNCLCMRSKNKTALSLNSGHALITSWSAGHCCGSFVIPACALTFLQVPTKCETHFDFHCSVPLIVGLHQWVPCVYELPESFLKLCKSLGSFPHLN